MSSLATGTQAYCTGCESEERGEKERERKSEREREREREVTIVVGEGHNETPVQGYTSEANGILSRIRNLSSWNLEGEETV